MVKQAELRAQNVQARRQTPHYEYFKILRANYMGPVHMSIAVSHKYVDAS